MKKTFKNMLTPAKKRRIEEDATVDYLIQLYAEQHTADGRLLDFIGRSVRREGENCLPR